MNKETSDKTAADNTAVDGTEVDGTAQPAIASSLSDKEREAIAKLPYEQARDQLIQAVQALEAGGLDLDASMRQWEIGEALSKRAQELLDQVRAKLDDAQAAQSSAGASAGTQSNLE
ncbi:MULTISPECIES: exodeoxyribonuclease VII small subunit [Bifidobacterium]|uniref:exodeoxyribonuclease VII small subunit n=1 Tax=Bifidobacterium TaxID=1678 RepID=UPI002356A2BE|nr:exodeoxyribonuclease VII small subunit [Bifidobacterium crudilactis]MCI1869236.1 exodeoxyribonuclease VII small subunit [Bifidobacterium crudilactis]MCI2148157.1 exodeoxyribonuclease VII small subunit [Bifidobacterium crudilactis]MCI2157161.1 exodeoxyribonuclease VII small subunit [Bifidobacterium crudilactis]MDN5972447.1 exodeoxyribonuclease VII small subunit [Bifidobacterium crudilactis]MDN6000357.1 exodeoxyribonuclease VII small subunit [Bifidobacterium crudilactis]